MGWDMLPHPRGTKAIESTVTWSVGDLDSGLFVGSPSRPRNVDIFPHIDIVLAPVGYRRPLCTGRFAPNFGVNIIIGERAQRCRGVASRFADDGPYTQFMT